MLANSIQTTGNDETGYSIGFDPLVASVRVVAWGFWPAELALGFDRGLVDAFRAAPSRSPLLLDVSRLKPMRDEGQLAVLRGLKSLKELGVPRISVMSSSPLTKLQFMRIVTEAGCRDITTFS